MLRWQVDAGAKRARGAPKEVTYKFQGGLRLVEPYDFDFTTHVKQRWVGRSLLEVCACEFVAFPRDYYAASIAAGRVTVDGRPVRSEHVLRDGELIAPWRTSGRWAARCTVRCAAERTRCWIAAPYRQGDRCCGPSLAVKSPCRVATDFIKDTSKLKELK